MSTEPDGRATFITHDTLVAYLKKIREEPVRPSCGTESRPHVVHPGAEGWTYCAECFGPVWAPGRGASS